MRTGMHGKESFGRTTALASTAAAILGTAGVVRAQAVDGFEDIASNAPTVVLTPVTGFGVTRGTRSLQIEVPQGTNAFWGMQSGNVADRLRAGATTLSYDMTLIGQQLNGGSFGVVFPAPGDNSFNGFAQSNVLAVVVATASGGFIQQDFSGGGATDSLSQNGQWNGVDGTRHITWNLNNFTSGGQSLAQFLTSTGATEAHFWFVTQGGDTNGNQGPMRFFWDNVVLSGGTGGDTVIGDFEPIPEPGSLAILGLALSGLLLRRRRA